MQRRPRRLAFRAALASWAAALAFHGGIRFSGAVSGQAAFFAPSQPLQPSREELDAEVQGLRKQLAARGIEGSEEKALEAAVEAANGLQGVAFPLTVNADVVLPNDVINGFVAELVASFNVQRQIRARGKTNADLAAAIPEKAQPFVQEAIEAAVQGDREQSLKVANIVAKELALPADEVEYFVSQCALMTRMKKRTLWPQGVGAACEVVKSLLVEETPIRTFVESLDERGKSISEVADVLRLGLEIEDRSKKLRAM